MTVKEKRNSDKKFVRYFSRTAYILLALNIGYMFFTPVLIGQSSLHYFLYILLLPFIAGAILFFILSYPCFKTDFSRKEKPAGKILGSFYRLVFIAFFSACGPVFVARVSFDTACRITAAKQVKQTMYCKIIRIAGGRRGFRNRIDFTLANHQNASLYIPAAAYKQYKNSDLSVTALEITLRPTIWDGYLVDSWQIVQR